MTKTNTKDFMKKAQAAIIEHVESVENLTADVQAAGWNCRTLRQKAIRFIEGGGLDCYYSQCAETLAALFDCSVDEIWQYYKNNEDKLWQSYIHIMSKNIECIVSGQRKYI